MDGKKRWDVLIRRVSLTETEIPRHILPVWPAPIHISTFVMHIFFSRNAESWVPELNYGGKFIHAICNETSRCSSGTRAEITRYAARSSYNVLVFKINFQSDCSNDRDVIFLQRISLTFKKTIFFFYFKFFYFYFKENGVLFAVIFFKV